VSEAVAARGRALLSRRATALRAAAALAGGVLLYFGTGLHPLWWAVWIGPIPLLAAAFASPPGLARLLVLAASLVADAGVVPYLLEVTGTLPTAIITLLRTLLWLFLVGRTRAAVLGSRSWAVVFVYPVLASGADMLISALSADGTALSLAYTQMDALPVIQSASWGGTAAVVFLPSLFASAAAVAWYRRGDLDRPLLAYGASAMLFVLLLGWGWLRTQNGSPERLTVAMAAVDVDGFAKSPEAVLSAYGPLIVEAARQRAAIVVLPEEVGALAPAAAEIARSGLAEAARANGVELLAGMRITGTDGFQNRAWLFSPKGEPVDDYAKRHPVPGLEGRMIRGSADATATIGDARFGIAICKDMDFPRLGRGYAALGVQAMLVPAWDFGMDGWLHGRMAVLRGVEGGFSIARAARDGTLSISDRYGRVLAERPTAGPPGELLVGALPLPRAAPTLYARLGDAFGWLMAAGLAGLVLRPLFRRGGIA
jgi:apolipoprotein N-acyltransferase